MPRISTRRRSSNSDDEDFSVNIRQARFKIGESYRDIGIHTSDYDEKLKFRKFVKETFHTEECRYFFAANKEVLDDKNEKCMCGEIKKYHRQDKAPFDFSLQWNKNNVMESVPSATFGKIEFIGEDITNTKLTDFIRLSFKDKMKDVINLMFNYWNIKVGTLCISVIGGASKFKMGKKEKDIFCQGLIKAAKATDALIITSGLNQGITRVVGDAIQNSQSYLYDKKKHNNFICCLGITPWDYIENPNILENSKGRTVQYKVSNEIKSKPPMSLNKNHTHYLFVDEGFRLGFSKTETRKFRAALERELSQESDERNGIPVVLLIVEGGHDVFQEACRCATENVPIVICEGTGRASDILGEAFREMQRISEMYKRGIGDGVPKLSKEYKSALKRKLIEQNVSNENEADEGVTQIEEIIRKDFLITLFDMNAHEDLDLVILYSLIKRMDHISENKQNSLSNQLSLCLIWNRIDIVKDKIFSGDISLSNDEWTAFLKESIISGKVEFIELFLQNVSNIQDFLTTTTLKELYEQCPKSKNFHKTFVRFIGRKYTKGLLDVKEILSKMIGKYENPCFITNEDIKHPFQELFLWAVLMEKHECAKFFWEKCDDSLFLALVATRIYKCHRRTSSMDTDRTQTLIKWKDHYENLAIKLVEECHDIDQETVSYLIEKENPTWGGITCLELAYKAQDQNFISCIVCQDSIDFKWRAGLNISFFRCILGILFPFWILSQTEYDKIHTTQESEKNQDSTERKYVDSCYTLSEKLKRFYLAPQTKFCIHSFTFIGFVIYLSYVVLYGMQRNALTIHEMIFMGYLILMIIDKIFEMLQYNSARTINRIIYWWKFNNWNKIDILIMVMAVTAMLLRLRLIINIWNVDYVIVFRCSKTIYSCIVGLFYLKCLRLLAFHKSLGPKMVMMIKLIEELMIFVTIILIFLLSYGITSQAAYYPQRDFSWLNLSNIFDYSYWTIFGVLNLPLTVYLNWCDPVTTNFNVSNNCPEQNIIIPILFAAYVLISNILILNVLIATYSYICHGIHRNSIEIWKFTMYSLVLEYDKKPLFPLPFSILNYVFNMFFFCCKKSRCNYSKKSSKFQIANVESGKSLNKQNLSKSATLMLSSDMNIESELQKLVRYFENNSQKSVIKEIVAKNQKTIESGILRMENRLKNISRELDFVQTKLKKKMISDNKSTGMDIIDNSALQVFRKMSTSSAQSKIINSHLSDIYSKTNLLLQELKKWKIDDTNDNLELIDKLKNENETLSSKVSDLNEKIILLETQKKGQSLGKYESLPENEQEVIFHTFKKRNEENAEQITNIDYKLDQFKDEMRIVMQNIESIIKGL